MSQSLLFFRAFQLEAKAKRLRCKSRRVAIPSFIQGISTLYHPSLCLLTYDIVAIPSFIQGISTVIDNDLGDMYYIKSQSLLLFRAFQQGGEVVITSPSQDVAIPSFIQGISTDFLYEREKEIFEGSQSLLLFRAFQLKKLVKI